MSGKEATMKKAMTIVVTFEEGADPVPFGDIGEELFGGEVTAMATYDVMHTMEIAERALEESCDDRCIEAAELIDAYIVQSVEGK